MYTTTHTDIVFVDDTPTMCILIFVNKNVYKEWNVLWIICYWMHIDNLYESDKTIICEICTISNSYINYSAEEKGGWRF